MPFLSPLWASQPRVVWLHHVHGDMWKMVLPPRLAAMGQLLEHRLAPALYRGTRIVTLSESSKRQLVSELHFRSDKVSVVPPGIDPQFSPGGERSPVPLVVAVGRLVPVKHFDRLLRIMARVREQQPDATLTIVGEGYERRNLDEVVRELDAESWVTFAGRITDDELVDLYRRAWVVASASSHEGWGMTLTEAAACGTPAVATRISGHLDAVAEGTGGLLAEDDRALRDHLVTVLSDTEARDRLSAGALAHAQAFTWEATAAGTLTALAQEARRRR